jgi:tRNA threonylcarbamoyladenosine biosynthesis protein TsaE
LSESELTIHCDSEDATRRFARSLGEAALPGLVVALVGDLGAGKTRLVQSAAEGLGVDPSVVNSPTFVLIQEYEGRLPVYHFDTYRLKDFDEFLELGADEYFSSGGVCFVEWADRMAEVLPRDRLTIEFEITGETTRTLRLSAGGQVSREVLARLESGV